MIHPARTRDPPDEETAGTTAICTGMVSDSRLVPDASRYRIVLSKEYVFCSAVPSASTSYRAVADAPGAMSPRYALLSLKVMGLCWVIRRHISVILVLDFYCLSRTTRNFRYGGEDGECGFGIHRNTHGGFRGGHNRSFTVRVGDGEINGIGLVRCIL